MCKNAARIARDNPGQLDEEIWLYWDSDVGIEGGTAPVTHRNVNRWYAGFAAVHATRNSLNDDESGANARRAMI